MSSDFCSELPLRQLFWLFSWFPTTFWMGNRPGEEMRVVRKRQRWETKGWWKRSLMWSSSRSSLAEEGGAPVVRNAFYRAARLELGQEAAAKAPRDRMEGEGGIWAGGLQYTEPSGGMRNCRIWRKVWQGGQHKERQRLWAPWGQDVYPEHLFTMEYIVSTARGTVRRMGAAQVSDTSVGVSPEHLRRVG